MSAQLYYISNVKGIAGSSVGMGPIFHIRSMQFACNYFRNYVAVKKRKFWADVSKFNDRWIHLVLNYIGPNMGDGIQAFQDGAFISRHQSGADGDHHVGDGQMVIGRRYPNRSQDYSHVQVDELIFFNEALSNEEVGQLYSMY